MEHLLDGQGLQVYGAISIAGHDTNALRNLVITNWPDTIEMGLDAAHKIISAMPWDRAREAASSPIYRAPGNQDRHASVLQ
ncbi:MAG: hypothetical protein LC114_23625 [Bryobacterales bacterium]|nr:hypothetical protein [Bryobacterales bacterium]